MYAQFRAQYPMGSLTAELLQAQEGFFLVRAEVKVGGVVMATGLSAAATIEQAEDQARSRALVVLGIEPLNLQTQAHLLEPLDQSDPDRSPARLNPATQDEILPMSGQFPSAADTAPEWVEPDSVAQLQAVEPPQVATEPVTHQTNGKGRRTRKTVVASPRHSSKRTEQVGEGMEAPTQPVDLSEIIAQTDVELKRLGWTSTQGRQYLQKTYNKRSRQQLTDDELLAFLNHLESQPSKDEPPF